MVLMKPSRAIKPKLIGRKIVQITNVGRNDIVALCDDGTLWIHRPGIASIVNGVRTVIEPESWSRMVDIPHTVESK